MARLVWKVIHATELSDALESRTLGQLVPEQPAVYLWRRRLVAPSSCRSSQEACQEWVTHVVGAPAATLTRRQLSHCVWTNGLQIGGGELTREKQQTLEEVSASRGTEASTHRLHRGPNRVHEPNLRRSGARSPKENYTAPARRYWPVRIRERPVEPIVGRPGTPLRHSL